MLIVRPNRREQNELIFAMNLAMNLATFAKFKHINYIHSLVNGSIIMSLVVKNRITSNQTLYLADIVDKIFSKA